MARSLMNLGVIALYSEDYVSALDALRARRARSGSELGEVRGPEPHVPEPGHRARGHGPVRCRQHRCSSRASSWHGGPATACTWRETLIELGKHLVQHRPADPTVPELLREGLELSSALGERRADDRMPGGAGGTERPDGSAGHRGRAVGAAEAERERAGIDRKPDEVVPVRDTRVRELAADLGPEAYARARARGRSRGLDIAVAVALESIRA